MPTRVDWAGYQGNDTIYATQWTGPQLLPNESASAIQYSNCQSGGIFPTYNNSVTASIETGASSVAQAESTGAASYYYFSDGHFYAYTIVGASGMGQILPYTITSNAAWVGAVLAQVAASGLPTGASDRATTGIQGQDLLGYNVTPGTVVAEPSGFDPEESVLVPAVEGALDIASIYQPEIAPFALPISLGLEWLGWAGLLDSTPAPGVSDVSNTTFYGNGYVDYWSQVTGGVQPTGLSPSQYGYNLYSEDIENLVNIPVKGLAKVTAGNETITTTNQLWGGGGYCNGASASISTRIDPAVAINGNVSEYPGGPVPNYATVTLVQTCPDGTTIDFDVSAANGHWLFFGKPGCDYSASAYGNVPTQSSFFTTSPVNISELTTSAAKGNVTPAVNLSLGYPVVFTETGVPSGDSWSVTVNGTEISTSSSSITFVEPNGSYAFSVGSISGYSVSPSSGTVIVSGGSVSKSITFTKNSGSFTAKFTESGLPSGHYWEVDIGDNDYSGDSTSISFSLTTGTYTYTIPSLAAGNCESYVAKPDEGQISNSAPDVSVTFSLEVTGDCPAPNGAPVHAPTVLPPGPAPPPLARRP